MFDSGIIIGLKNKEHKYRQIIQKLLKNKILTKDEEDFLKKENII